MSSETPSQEWKVRSDGLSVPLPSRWNEHEPTYAEAMGRHHQAVAAKQLGYMDPKTDLFVMTSQYLADRGWCCERGCRHCPYEPR